jgi:2',3'-cyclic-nucleotide 2'-phosphodiesterase (5'-nucleotidase family)
VKLNGTQIANGTTYRIVTNNFLQGGGDNFPTMAQGKNVYFGGLDIDAFANYLTAHSPYTPATLTRITKN